MRKAFLLSAVDALLLACGGEDPPGPRPGPGLSEQHLAFTIQPSTTVAGQVITPPVQVSVLDAAGNPVTSSGTAIVTLTLNNPGTIPGTLKGTTTRPATNGVAVFSDLSINKVSVSSSFKAKAPEIIGDAISREFAVLSGPAAAIAIRTGDSQLAGLGNPVPKRPQVRVTDEFGNGVPGVSVTFEVLSGGGTVEGAQVTTNVNGVAVVTSWRVGTSPGPNTLRATAGTLTPVIFTATAAVLPTAITIAVHDSFFRSVRNGSGNSARGPENDPQDTVAVGGTMTWVWMGENHNVEQVSHEVDVEPTPEMSPSGNHDAPFTFGPITFSTPGTLWYRCTNHSRWFGFSGTGEIGSILVR
jgi:plastocyanin